jgi:hypothetical protein
MKPNATSRKKVCVHAEAAPGLALVPVSGDGEVDWGVGGQSHVLDKEAGLGEAEGLSVSADWPDILVLSL